MKQPSRKADAIRKKKEEILARLNARIAEADRLDASRQRKEDIRHKIVFGACLLADLETNADLRVLLEMSLKRTASGRDLEFLRTKGWRI